MADLSINHVQVGRDFSITITYQNGVTRTVPFLAPPRPPDGLEGRDTLLADIKRVLLQGGLSYLVLTGLPGAGKSAVAQELTYDHETLSRFSDGVIWAGLGRRINLSAVLLRWGIALGLTPEQMETEGTLEARARLIHEQIGLQKLLLVLDDLWDAGTVTLFYSLLGPRCALLITTRLNLTLPARNVQTVEPLSVESGVFLLTKLTEGAISSDDATVLAKSVDGLPLALCIMGHYLRSQVSSPRRAQEAITRLQDAKHRLGLQPPQHLGSPEQSLQAVIDVSERELQPTTCKALQSLAVFPSKPNYFTYAAAAFVIETAPEAIDELYESGLLERVGPDAYTLHQVVADYARRNGLDMQARKRFVLFYVTWLDQSRDDYCALDVQIKNICAALEVAYQLHMTPELIKGAVEVATYLVARGLYGLAVTYLKYAQQLAEIECQPGLAEVYLHLGCIEEKQGHYDAASRYLQAGLDAAYQNSRGPAIIWKLLHQLGVVAFNIAEYAVAERWLKSGLEEAKNAGDREGNCMILQRLDLVAFAQGQYTSAEQHAKEGLELAKELCNVERISALYADLGRIELKLGRYAEAFAYAQSGLPFARKISHSENLSALFQILGRVALEQQEYESAEKYFNEALRLARDIGHRWYISLQLIEKGKLDLRRKQLDDAARAFREARECARSIRAKDLLGYAFFGLARVAGQQGWLIEAHHAAELSWTILEGIGHHKSVEVSGWLEQLKLSEDYRNYNVILPLNE